MKNIKIFVSNRIDVNSVKIDNPLYVPVRCGAVFDDRGNREIVGDDTGDNISTKRNSFCEFTVQYWAWKNVEADYYGLCHYRRFLTFSPRTFKANVQEQVLELFLSASSIRKYDLLNESWMQEIIEENDVIVNPAADVTKIPTPQGKQKDVYGHWAGHDGVFIDKRTLSLLVKMIHDLHPEYSASTEAYLQGKWHRGYNCYVMKKTLFQQMCTFQFDVLFALEEQLMGTEYLTGMGRTLGYLGEILYGIFIYHLSSLNQHKIYEAQMVYFEQTEQPKNFMHAWMQIMLFWAKIKFENTGYILLPKASKRRDFIKKIYFALKNR